MKKLEIPADVPKNSESIFIENYTAITKSTNQLFLFTADHKIEHLNKDFYNKNIPAEVNDPERLFEIANEGEIGAFATQLGLIARYGKKYPDIHYIAKLNSKTDIIPSIQKDPVSRYLWNIEDVIQFKKNSGLKIAGIGYTVYIGSEFEDTMLQEAAQLIYQAHQHGLIAIIWMYPRGKNIKNKRSADLIAGAAGIANCLGADFAKINPPTNKKGKTDSELLTQSTQASGNTKILCSGGTKIDKKEFLRQLYAQIQIGGTSGAAIGRNIYQNTLKDAIEMTKAIAAIVYENGK